MASLPYVTAPGNVAKALNAIVSAATPNKITQDFVKEILLIPGGSGNQITSFLKKIGMANSDGSPTDTYSKFRNETTRSDAALSALKHGYKSLYDRNEYVHTVSTEKLKGLVIEATGADEKSRGVMYTVKCIQGIKGFITKDVVLTKTMASGQENTGLSIANTPDDDLSEERSDTDRGVGMNLSYTINLNLPATSDIAVFNAIFKSLKENLLRGTHG